MKALFCSSFSKRSGNFCFLFTDFLTLSTDFSTGCGLLLWKNKIPNKCSCFVQIVQAYFSAQKASPKTCIFTWE